ncbi:MAG: TRAP transporter substrate-binding protein [Opitutaceae bacterium]|jgi:tripartite ATP-independent transporter DctP family solute receptor|nr:TRAP transporter substrate-binding protein [Opitutaceae bacterium]
MDRSTSFFSLGVVAGVLSAAFVFTYTAGDRDGGGDSAKVLKLAHGLDTGHPVHLGMVRMQERVAELSGGRLKIDIYPSGVLGSEVQCIEQLQSGELAMTKTSTAAMESFIPQLGIFGVPYLFDDEDHFWRVIDSEVGRELLAIGEDSGLFGLCFYDAGSRNFYSTDKPIRSPADLQGMKIRVQNSRMAIAMVEALGGSPTPIAWGELYSALAQGVVDGAENNMPSFESNRHYEECKYFTPDAHTRVPDLLMISTTVWQSLDPQEQAWLQEAADISSTYQRELWAVKTMESMAKVIAAGVEIVDCDPSAFQLACEPIKATLAGTPVEPWMHRIQATK